MINGRVSDQPRRAVLRPYDRPRSLPPGPTWLDSLIFLALLSGPPKFRMRDATASLAGEIDAMVMVQIAAWIGGGIWVFANLYPSLLRRGTVPPLNPAQLLGALLILTLSFSLGESPGLLLTAFMLAQFAVTTAFAWLFAHRYGTQTFLRHLFWGTMALLVLIGAAAIYAPELVMAGGEGRLRGDQIAPTGAVAAMGLVFCFSNVPRLRIGVWWLATGLAAVLFVAAQTRTAYIALIAFLAIGYVRGSGLRVRKLVPLLVGLLLALALLDRLPRVVDFVVREEQTLETMSDRLPLWEHLTETVMREAPVTGLGYYAASRVLAPQYNRLLGTAHSVFFEVLVGGGLLATTVYLLLCGSLLWYAGQLLRARTQRPEAVALGGLLVVCLVQAVTGSDGINAGPVGFAFWSLTALLPRVWRETRTVGFRTSRSPEPWARVPRGQAARAAG